MGAAVSERRSWRGAVGVALVLGAAACGNDEITGPEPVPIEETIFAPELQIDLDAMTKDTAGYYYVDLVVGDSVPVDEGYEVGIYYTLWLSDGTEIDSNVAEDEEEPLPALAFTIGAQEVIQGLDLGMRGMLVGGVRKLVLPYTLGYGANDVLDRNDVVIIPRYSTLVVEVELASAEPPPPEEEEGPAGP